MGLFLSIAISCKKSSDSSSTVTGSSKGSISATINGTSFATSLVTTASHGDTTLIVGQQLPQVLELATCNPSVGSHTINNLNNYGIIYTNASGSTYYSQSGTINITSLSSTEIKGTFSGTLTNITTTISCTNGQFDVFK